MSRPSNDRFDNPAFHPSAAARNTILILSGYLLGSAAAHICPPTLERGALAAGLIGALAYAVLAFLSRQKQLAGARQAIRKATVHVERRMDQHVRIASAHLMLKLHAAQAWSHEQYVPVVCSANSMR
jgi:hypothetical protein